MATQTINAESVLGPILIGVLFNTLLFGTTFVQGLIYYRGSKRDPAWIRYFILYLCICETANTGCAIGAIYESAILRFGSPDALILFPKMAAAEPLMTVMISTPIQYFVAWRIMMISQSKLIALPICLLALISFGAGITTGVEVIRGRTFISLMQNKPSAITWLMSSAVADVLITASLIYNLFRRKTGLPNSDDLISRIIRMTLQTGLLTTICVILEVALITTKLDTTMWAISFPFRYVVEALRNIKFRFTIFDYCLAKLYTNALLSTLNARPRWNKLRNDNGGPNVLFCDLGDVADSKSGARESPQTIMPTNLASNTTIYNLNAVGPGAHGKDSKLGIMVTEEVIQADV